MYKTAELSAENAFTDVNTINGEFNVSITGTWVGTVTLQRSLDDGITWGDVNSWTENFQGWDKEPQIIGGWTAARAKYRLGFKTGEYTSGTATCTVGNG